MTDLVPYYGDDRVTVYAGDCLDVLAGLPDSSVDSVVTDPPYGLEFMGKDWDAPWQRGDDINADAGFTPDGMGKGFTALPSFTGSTNPKCLNCKGTKRGRRDGTAVVAVCTCDHPAFPNVRATEMRAFQAWCTLWATECHRVLKPGGHLLAFGGTRTAHRLTSAIEDAGFEIRDSIAWLYGSGFPKSLDVSKAIDKAAGAERDVIDRVARDYTQNRLSENPSDPGMFGNGDGERLRTVTAPATPDAATWAGWGTALKPAHEPITVARKPLVGTVAANVLAHGTGALNIDACRIGTDVRVNGPGLPGGNSVRLAGGDGRDADNARTYAETNKARPTVTVAGRWPPNVALDTTSAAALDHQTGDLSSHDTSPGGDHASTHAGTGYNEGWAFTKRPPGRGDTGGASRFMYVAKADTNERIRHDVTAHPTVKPLDLMRWLVRLVTPPGGLVLDPFAGSGTTAEACLLEGFRAVVIEREPDYLPLITQRVHRRRDPVAYIRAAGEDLGLFGLDEVDPDGTSKPAGGPKPRRGGDLSNRDTALEGGDRIRTDYDGGQGRWPPNVILDRDTATTLDQQSGITSSAAGTVTQGGRTSIGGLMNNTGPPRDGEGVRYGGTGGASRFFPIITPDE